MSEHTPGPWTVEDPMFGELNIVEAGKQTYEWRFIASIDISPEAGDAHPIPNFEAKANARLIAAAPDLLAALEAVNKCDGAILPQDIWFTIFEAVHKATGGQRP